VGVEEAMRPTTDWTYESDHALFAATPELRERFREAARTYMRNHADGDPDDASEVEKTAALAWRFHAMGLGLRADVLYNEGASYEEIRRNLREEPDVYEG
jgi:hypothetical protein